MAPSERFVILDGFRGLAAVGILVFHFCAMFSIPALRHAYLAVDLFFLMSGFVLAQAYEGKLRDGLTFGRFAKMRLARLYPIYALGILLGIATTYLVMTISGVAHAEKPVSVTGSLSMLLLPSPYGAAPFAFPVNPPAWSLFYEVVVSLIYAAVASNLSNRVLHGATAVSAMVLVAAVIHAGGADLGSRTEEYPGALARVIFSFSVGVRLFRLHRDGALERLPRVPPWLLMAGLAGIVAMPFGRNAAVFLDLTSILIAFPLLCALAVKTECRGRTATAFARLGAVSYPLYMTHAPVLSGFEVMAVLCHLPMFAMTVVGLVAAILFAWGTSRYYELPIRRRLSRHLARDLAGQPLLSPT